MNGHHDLRVDATVLRGVLSQYPAIYRPRRLESPAFSGFSGALILRLETDAGPFCLRCWPNDGPNPSRIFGLHRLLRHIHASGVSEVAVPVLNCHGSTLLFDYGRCWQLEPWMPGRADYRENPSSAKLRAAMESLALWHGAAASFTPRELEIPWFRQVHSSASPAVIERLDRTDCWIRGDLSRLRSAVATDDSEWRPIAESYLAIAEQLLPAIHSELYLMSRKQFTLQPVLRDIWHDHVLFFGETVTGLIDPSACRSENVAADIARLIGSLVGDDCYGWQCALETYQKHRPLSSNERELMNSLDRSGVLLSGLTWLNRIYLEKTVRAGDHKLGERVRSRLTQFLQRLRNESEFAEGTGFDQHL